MMAPAVHSTNASQFDALGETSEQGNNSNRLNQGVYIAFNGFKNRSLI